jgi:nucleoside-diphosphate-sugar epimerase
MNVCVTGASGFLGTHLLQRAATDDALHVRSLTRRRAAAGGATGRVTSVIGDLLDPATLTRFIEPGAVVVHLAYSTDAPAETNLRAAHNLAHACATSEAATLVHLSTAIVVGRSTDDVITEDTPSKPVGAYERTKLRIEEILIERLAGRCPVIVLRPTAIFGPGGRNLLKLSRELRSDSRAVGQVKASLFGRRRMNLVAVDNVAAAILFLVRGAQSHGARFIISDDEAAENNYADVVRTLCSAFDRPEPRSIPLPFAETLLSLGLRAKGASNTNPRRVYSAHKLAAAGFRKPIAFDAALRAFARWLRAQ